MTPTQRQRLVNAGFSRKGLADVDFILDRISPAQHDAFITSITTPRPPFKSTSREMTRKDMLPGTDAEIGRLVADTLRDEIRTAIHRVTGRVE